MRVWEKNPLAGKRGWTKLKCPSGTLETEVLTGVSNSFNCLMKNVCKAKKDLKFLLSGSFLTRLCMWNMYYEPFKKGTLHFKRCGSVRFIVDSFIFLFLKERNTFIQQFSKIDSKDIRIMFYFYFKYMLYF